MTRRPHQNRNQSPRDHRWVLVCSALLAVPIMLACMPATITVESLPANQLDLTVTITNQYADTPQVSVRARLMLARNPSNPLDVTMPHTLTCDGVTVITGTATTGGAYVPRQSEGGAYTWVYTDEQGYRTMLAIPVPRGAFTVTAPLPQTQIPIPAPTPAPELVITYTLPTPPTAASTQIRAMANAAPSCAATGNPSRCAAYGDTLPATGYYVLRDSGNDDSGFQYFTPGSGRIEVWYWITWSPPGGFGTATVTYTGQRIIPVVWTR